MTASWNISSTLILQILEQFIVVNSGGNNVFFIYNYSHGDCPMSTLSVDTIQGKTTAGTVAMPSGMVVQTASVNCILQ